MDYTDTADDTGIFTEPQLKAIEAELDRLKNVSDETLTALNTDSINRRLQWFKNNRASFDFIGKDLLLSAYRLLLRRFGITPTQAPIVFQTENQIVLHSMNFCPTLEACKILGLDTRYVCKCMNERSTDLLIKQLDPRLTFSRNYNMLRPYADYCEEMISLAEDVNNDA